MIEQKKFNQKENKKNQLGKPKTKKFDNFEREVYYSEHAVHRKEKNKCCFFWAEPKSTNENEREREKENSEQKHTFGQD